MRLPILFLTLILCLAGLATAQTPGTVIWQVNSFDINANVQQDQRALNATTTINATNVGNGPGRTLTVRLNSKASVKSVTVGGAAANFRPGQETRGDLLRVEISLPAPVAPNSTVTATVTYALPVESNTGLMAISPIGTEFLPLSFWYPMPNTPYSVRGADTAPFHLTVSISNVISSGVEKPGPTPIGFDETLHGQPFFVQGDWDRVEGAADGKGIAVLLEKGLGAEERKHAEALISFAAAARAFYAAALGSAPDVPIRLVAVRRGAGFSDSGTVLIDADTVRLPKIDAATALSISEAVVHLWIGGQTQISGEGGGVLRDGLVRFLATQFLEKQFGPEAVKSELYRQRLAYVTVAQRDAPLAHTTPLDSTYFASVPNRGAMFWRLVDRKLDHEGLIAVMRASLQAGKSDPNGLTLPALREALAARGGQGLKTLMDQQLDQVIDTDLLIGLPQQRGAEWVSALRNLGSTDVTVTVEGTTERGEQVLAEATVPAKNFGEAVFKTPVKIVRAEIDPEKLYPQVDYGNDVA